MSLWSLPVNLVPFIPFQVKLLPLSHMHTPLPLLIRYLKELPSSVIPKAKSYDPGQVA